MTRQLSLLAGLATFYTHVCIWIFFYFLFSLRHTHGAVSCFKLISGNVTSEYLGELVSPYCYFYSVFLANLVRLFLLEL